MGAPPAPKASTPGVEGAALSAAVLLRSGTACGALCCWAGMSSLVALTELGPPKLRLGSNPMLPNCSPRFVTSRTCTPCNTLSSSHNCNDVYKAAALGEEIQIPSNPEVPSLYVLMGGDSTYLLNTQSPLWRRKINKSLCLPYYEPETARLQPEKANSEALACCGRITRSAAFMSACCW